MTDRPDLIVAVDGGGSGCRVRLTDHQGQVVATAAGGPANIRTDFDRARDNILGAIRDAYAQIGEDMARAPRDTGFLGLAGAGQRALAEHMEQALDFGRLRVVDDRETTVQGALEDGDGTVALVGTGSFFIHRDQGRLQKIGGWGLDLGDECGGAWLGRELLRATVQAQDGLFEHSALTQSVLAQMAKRPDGIVGFAKAAAPSDFARFAPEIAQANRTGDPVAARIMATAVHLFCERLDALGDGGKLCVLGGLAETYTPLLPERFGLRACPPLGTALDGATALGIRLRHDTKGLPPP